jgi:flagellar biosynthesis/type III secretory pathway protein FliH
MDNTMTLDFNSKSNEDLPLSITMNGIEYLSSKLFDSSQNLSKINLELSKVGLELCRNEVISEPSSPDGYESIINDALKYGDGYTAYQDGYFAGKKKGYDEGYKQGECDGFGKGYGRGFSEGHDIGWKAAKKEPQPNDHYYDDEELYELKKEWYEQGFANGKLSNSKDSTDNSDDVVESKEKLKEDENIFCEAVFRYYDDEELYELKKEWYEQGFANGKVEGNDEGYKEGFADGKLSNSKDSTDNSDVVVESKEKLKEDKNELCEAFFRGYKQGMDRMVAEIVKPISRKKPLEEAFKRGYEVCKEDEFKKGYVEGYNACIDCFNIDHFHKIDDNDVSDM